MARYAFRLADPVGPMARQLQGDRLRGWNATLEWRSTMSIRIGVGFGGWPFPKADPQMLWDYVDAAEALDVDSIWLSDRIVSSAST